MRSSSFMELSGQITSCVNGASSLRILYYYPGFHSDFENSAPGYFKKSAEEVRGLNVQGLKCKGILFAPDCIAEMEIAPNLSLLPLAPFSRLNEKSDPFEKATQLFQSFSTYLLESGEPIDFYYIRSWYLIICKEFLKFANQYGSKIILEHNSDDFSDLSKFVSGKLFTSSGRLPSISSWSQQLQERHQLATAILSKIPQGVAVTRELATKFEKKALNHRCIVVPNRIEVSKVNPPGPLEFNHQVLNCIMLQGGSWSWHGEDRFIRGMFEYKGATQINLHILGDPIEKNIELIDSLKLFNRVKYFSRFNGKNLARLMQLYHLGIGSLALFRKNMFECSSLKHREYFAHGLPFIYACSDSDFAEGDSAKYSKLFPGDESPINMGEVIGFAAQAYEDPQCKVKVRGLAERHLDYSLRSKQLVKYFSGLGKV